MHDVLMSGLQNPANHRTVVRVLNAPIDVGSWDDAVERVVEWGQQRRSAVVCICNAHSVVTAGSDPRFAEVLARSDLNTADGASVAWMLRRLGYRRQPRINGPDLMWRACAAAAEAGVSVFLYGGSDRTLHKLEARLREAFPGLSIAGSLSPPYRDLSPEEDAQVVALINASGAGLLWVGLGCPKQELWMHAHRGRIQATMLGVGAAFDYHAGTLRRAPKWAQRHGLEWAYRLVSEPRRLWRRYLVTNTLFILGAVRQLMQPRR